MKINKPIYLIAALSILFTLIIQLDITRAIIFKNYLNTRQISGVNYYLSMINESSKGNWILGSPYLSEWRYAPYLNPSLSFNAAGLFKRTFSLDIKSYATIMGYMAVFSIMFLVLTAFAQIFDYSYFGYLAAAAYIFFPRVIMWNRTWSPEINFIPFALFLVVYFSRFSFRKREFSLAFLTGALFYVYPYYWTFALALLAVSDLQQFWNMKRIIWEYAYKYLAIAGFAFWYVAHLWQLSHLSYYKESLVRIGFLYSRMPAGWYTQGVLLMSLCAFFFLKKYVFPKLNSEMPDNTVWNKIVAGLITGLIVLNQQLITGVQMEFNSHYAPIILFFLVAFWGVVITVLINNSNFYFRNILILFSFILVIGFGIVKINSIVGGFDSDIYIGGRADEVVNWFLDNQIRDKIVYAPKDLGDEINLWTNNYLIFHDGQETQLMPTSELIDRFTYYDITNHRLTDNLFEEQTQIFGHTFDAAMQKDNVINSIKAKFSGKNFIPATLEEYTKYDFEPMHQIRINHDTIKFNEYLEKYHVDYLVYKRGDAESIYKEVSGKIVFDGQSYLVKKRE